MDMSLPLDAREVLFHLNYMGYRNITKEQLKSFMTDLKKLIRYESNPNAATSHGKSHTIHHPANVERLFETHTKTSLQKQKQKLPDKPKINSAPAKPMTTDQNIQHKTKEDNDKPVEVKEIKETIKKKAPKVDKENVPVKNENNEEQPQKSKMWIRQKSAQATRAGSARKRTDPVALYQEYQKDWARFKDNICESSRSDLRWQIREKMSRQS